MKKFLFFLICINMFFIINCNVFAIEEPDIFSNNALLLNMNTDEILFKKNTNVESVPIASLTKIMTYVLAVENIPDLNTKIVVPVGTKQEIIDKEGSNAGLEDEYEYTALDLLYGLMVPSGCDAADVLAKYISNNDYDKFVEMMNEKAIELGLENTIFYNASGLKENDNNSLSTTRDLYKLAKYAYTLPHFKEIIGTEFYTVKGTKGDFVAEKTVRNTNYMMGEYNGAEYFYPYSLGGKTGNLSEAGRCLISFAKKGKLELIAVTLGVPNEHSNYHLEDHRKLFEYGFSKYSENICIDLGAEYRSVDVGAKIEIIPTTSEKTKVTWLSSDESVATVSSKGVVTGKKIGQAKITAITSTGNIDYTYVSVGFYNGVDVKYSSGPSDTNGILGYGELDWSIIKNAGIDYAIVRAGYALNNIPDSDPYFVKNIENAIENDLNVFVSFDGYAITEEHAVAEARYLIEYLDANISEYINDIELSIVYNLYTSSQSDVEILKNIIMAFEKEMKEEGYSTIVELGKTKFSTIDLQDLTDSEIGLYVIWRPYVPEFEKQMSVPNEKNTYNSDLWSYRTDAYFGNQGIGKKVAMSVMYMDSDHSNYFNKPVLKFLMKTVQKNMMYFDYVK